MQNGRMTNMNTRRPKPAGSPPGRSQRWASSALRPEARGSHNARRNYNGTWHWPKLNSRRAIGLRPRTTTSTPNTISGRCPRTHERHTRLL
jgi:hypothetical protein